MGRERERALLVERLRNSHRDNSFALALRCAPPRASGTGLDVKLEEEDAAFTLAAVQTDSNISITLDSRNGGTFELGSTKGKAGFKVGEWHTVELVFIPGSGVSAKLDGKVLANEASPPFDDGFAFKMQLDSYIYAQVDNWQLH